MVSLEFFIGIILPVALWPQGGSASNRNENHKYFLLGKGDRHVVLITLTPSCERLFRISGSPKRLEPYGLSRPVMG
jgi:hypothetical protein